MYFRYFGCDYYLDEQAFVERMTQAAANHPWRMEEIVAIQRQLRSLESMLIAHIQATAIPDPMEVLRAHLRELTKEDAACPLASTPASN